jgi:hypothetical protein
MNKNTMTEEEYQLQEREDREDRLADYESLRNEPPEVNYYN